MNKQMGVIIGALVVTIIGVGVVTGLMIYNTPRTVVTTQKEEPVESLPETTEPMGDTQVTLPSDEYGDYISGAENIFVNACVDGDISSKAFCKCTYDWLDSHLTNDEFYDVTIEATKDGIPDAMYDAVKACT